VKTSSYLKTDMPSCESSYRHQNGG